MEKHPNWHGMAGENGTVQFCFLKRRRRALNHQTGRRNEFSNRQTWDLLKFQPNIMEAHVIGDDKHQHVEPRLQK